MQAPAFQPLACWRLYNRSANSCPLSRLDITDIKPPISQTLVQRARQCAHSATLSLSCSVTLQLFTSLPLHPFDPVTFDVQLSPPSPGPDTLTRLGTPKFNCCHTYKNTGGPLVAGHGTPVAFSPSSALPHSTLQHSTFFAKSNPCHTCATRDT